jgi:hypothetical protein
MDDSIDNPQGDHVDRTAAAIAMASVMTVNVPVIPLLSTRTLVHAPDPWNGASPKQKTPPSAAASQ